MDGPQREAFVLTQLLGLTYTEAASTAEVPVGTIRSRVARARAQLIAAVEAAEAHHDRTWPGDGDGVPDAGATGPSA